MNIIILGPQGSGKGTQAELLSHKFGLYHHDTTFLREMSKKDKKIKEMMDKGELIPDEDIFDLTKEQLLNNASSLGNIVFDGYPRSVKQYKLLKRWFSEKGQKIDLAILLDIGEKESIRRLSARRICEKCGKIYNLISNPPPTSGCECGGRLIQREDDKPKAIKERLKLYNERTKPLIELLDKEGILVKIDGERPINIIFEELKRIVERLNG